MDIPLYIAIDNRVLVQQGLNEQQMTRWCQTLEQCMGQRFTLEGNTYLRDEENLWGIHIVNTPTNVEVILVCQTAFAPPQDLIAMTHDFFQCIATLWKHSI
ncbi:hypothetical protein KFU94_10525 [Chloroflexi bacterium TSY]|nr:hypothetical protein [Chloroflexi bacterium TSY]